MDFAIHRFDQGRAGDLVERDLAIEAADVSVALDILDVDPAAKGVFNDNGSIAGRGDGEGGSEDGSDYRRPARS